MGQPVTGLPKAEEWWLLPWIRQAAKIAQACCRQKGNGHSPGMLWTRCRWSSAWGTEEGEMAWGLQGSRVRKETSLWPQFSGKGIWRLSLSKCIMQLGKEETMYERPSVIPLTAVVTISWVQTMWQALKGFNRPLPLLLHYGTWEAGTVTPPPLCRQRN